MEAILELMQDPHSGIVVKTVKSFMSKIPSVFTGKRFVQYYFNIYSYFKIHTFIAYKV